MAIVGLLDPDFTLSSLTSFTISPLSFCRPAQLKARRRLIVGHGLCQDRIKTGTGKTADEGTLKYGHVTLSLGYIVTPTC